MNKVIMKTITLMRANFSTIKPTRYLCWTLNSVQHCFYKVSC